MATKEERYEKLEHKKDVYDEAFEYAENLYNVLNDSEIAGLQGILKTIEGIKDKLEEKRDKADESLSNIDL